ncbi:hypothetical protein EMIT0P291_840001 [Pseudomonas sp. IT-P291]
MRSAVRICPDPPILYGAIAQLGERLPCTQEVNGSIPFGSTINCFETLESLEMNIPLRILISSLLIRSFFKNLGM